MARKRRKKVKRRRARRKVKKEIVSIRPMHVVIGFLVAAILFGYMFGLYLPNLQTSVGEGTSDIVSSITLGGACVKDSECFTVSCKSGGVSNCVNTEQMENYHKSCKGWWDVAIEKQDISRCSCIQNYCRTS